MIIVLIWIIAVVVGVLIGQSKGRIGLALVLTLLLSWLGVVIVALLPPAGPKGSKPSIGSDQPVSFTPVELKRMKKAGIRTDG